MSDWLFVALVFTIGLPTLVVLFCLDERRKREISRDE